VPETGCLPTPGQILLLKAALAPEAQALEAWLEWEIGFGLDRPDEGSYRLLPLVYRNLAAQASRIPEGNVLKGIHRRSWSHNQVLFHQVRPFLEELRRDGIPVLLLKGAALALRVYPDTGCRPMRDVDVMIPAAAARARLPQLIAAGCKALCWLPAGLPEGFFQFRHAADLATPEGARVDLHWHALTQCCHPTADDLFWRSAQPLDFLGLPLETCGPTAHLLEICAQGTVWSPVPPVRWAADAVLLLRSSHAEIDWEGLTRTVCDLDLAPYVSSALTFLRNELAAPVPADALERLARSSASRAATLEFARDANPTAPRSAWQDLLCFYSRWRRSLAGAPPLFHPAGFARHLQYAFEVDTLPALARRLARSASERCSSPHF
jgi:hypothetical protein